MYNIFFWQEFVSLLFCWLDKKVMYAFEEAFCRYDNNLIYAPEKKQFVSLMNKFSLRLE